MALIHKATLVPTKLELLTGWLPNQSWFPRSADPAQLRQAGAYRFDDPANEVGIEAFLVQAGDEVLHVPMTYRSAPVAGADDQLIGTTEHSVLGTRWVYDGCGDPIWAAALATAVLTGGTQVEELVQSDGELVPRRPTATVSGSGGQSGSPASSIDAVNSHDDGATTIVRAPGLELIVVRVVGAELPSMPTLTGRWGDDASGVLAGVRTV
jgi:hypothetical protein